MDSALKKLEEKCSRCDGHLGTLKEVLGKMKNCPPIAVNTHPIVAAKLNDQLYILIAGDLEGEPRLFAYDRNGDYLSEVNNKIEKSQRFKKKGLSHSIGVEEVANMLERASKANYKLELAREQQRSFYKHFS